jgi:hypothetical protein
MINWRFKLNSTEIDEPIGFDTISFNVMRDERWHGIFFEASASQLSFYGEAYNILKEAKETFGVDAVVIFTAENKCEGETDYEVAISGKLNFGNYQETCGNECLIRLSIEQDNCSMIFKNRFDQKVDIDTNVAFDKVTNLVAYDGLGFTMPLATQEIPISTDADVSIDLDFLNLTAVQFFLGEQNLLIRPTYLRVNDNSILTGQLDNPFNNWQDPANMFLLTPQLLLEENSDCISDEFNYNIRLKGAINVNNAVYVGAFATLTLRVCVDIWDGVGTHTGPGNLTGDAIPLHNDLIGELFDSAKPFDKTYSGTVTIPLGWSIYAYIKVYYSAGVGTSVVADFDVEFNPETMIQITNTKVCPPTDAKVYLVNETLARVTESITDRCLTIKSDYFGRIDSEPYTSVTDGCGSLRVLTPGLKIRQAVDKNFFASMKELMEGLRAVDNIGMGMESNNVRIEPVQYFYQDIKIMDLPSIPKSKHDLLDSKVFSNIKCGYAKWEIKSIKGIDEFNSEKEYRTSIKAIKNELDIRCNFITSGYIIENLRTTTLLNSGNTDSTYDNDIFLICVKKNAYGYEVEQGIVESASNFFSPTTAYNWRIRPIYNLMRWFKSIAQSYPNISFATSKLFFTSGKGNYKAEGVISATDLCRIENKILAENSDIFFTDFQNIIDSIPIYKPEIITFDYPLSVAEYKLIKATPYGYFNTQCGTGDFFKAFIINIEYKPVQGMAQFTLIKSWQ